MRDEPIRCGLAPMHPGELLREDILPALKKAGTPRTAVAARLGIGRTAFYEILDGRAPVTPQLAVKLGALFSNTAEFWANLQQSYDLAHARTQLGDALPAPIAATA